MKDYYVPDFERKWFKHENQDKFKRLKDSNQMPYKNSFKESWYAHVCCCDWRIAWPSIFRRGCLSWFISSKNLKLRSSTSTKKISLAPKDSWNTCIEELILYLHLYVFSTIIQINQIKSTSYVVCITRENRINFFIIASGEVPNFSWYG